ncbi:MAG: hypothetical protein ABIO37_01205, partial [Caulobacteraceae bacterium]
MAMFAAGAALSLFSAGSDQTWAQAFTAKSLAPVPTGNWATNGGNVYNQRYSALTRLSKATVKNLKAVWHADLDKSGIGP